jgi:hypothetical protein
MSILPTDPQSTTSVAPVRKRRIKQSTVLFWFAVGLPTMPFISALLRPMFTSQNHALSFAAHNAKRNPGSLARFFRARVFPARRMIPTQFMTSSFQEMRSLN